MADTEQTIVLSILAGAGNTIAQRYILEAVGDIEVTDSVELATEPGVMGRIGPKFPRSASFGVRLRDADPRTPLHKKARDQHALLRSMIGKLLYLDARASPPEKIVWTLENIKASDDNSAKNAYDVTVTAREIIGGEFGEFIDPTELSSDTGLVPIAIVAPPVATGIGDQTINVEMVEALLKGPDDLYPYHAAGADLYRLNYLSNYYEANQSNFNAISDVASSHGAQTLIDKGPRTFLQGQKKHIIVYGGKLPEIIDCTVMTLKFSALGVDFEMECDATNLMVHLKVTHGTNEFTMQPFTPHYLQNVALEPLRNSTKRRKDISYPENLDCIVILAPDKKDRKFSAKNLNHFSIVLAFMGDII